MSEREEPDYVEECPECGDRFIGMSPDEFRENHAPECNPLLKLLSFAGGNPDV